MGQLELHQYHLYPSVSNSLGRWVTKSQKAWHRHRLILRTNRHQAKQRPDTTWATLGAVEGAHGTRHTLLSPPSRCYLCLLRLNFTLQTCVHCQLHREPSDTLNTNNGHLTLGIIAFIYRVALSLNDRKISHCQAFTQLWTAMGHRHLVLTNPSHISRTASIGQNVFTIPDRTVAEQQHVIPIAKQAFKSLIAISR